MKKNFYEKGRMKFYQRQQLMELDLNTFSAIAITMAVFFFGGVILLMLSAFDMLPDAIAQQIAPTPISKTKSKKGDTQPLELSFIETPDKQTIQALVIPPKKIVEAIKPKPPLTQKPFVPEKAVINQHKEPAKKKKVTKKKKPISNKAKVPVPQKAKNLPELPPEAAVASNETFQVKSLPSENETYDEKLIRLYLMAQVQQYINTYKEHIPKKYKYIRGSYIMNIELNLGKKAQVIPVTESINKYFNLYVKRTFDTVEYPSLNRYKLKTYKHTFVIYYKPLVKK